ncbi:MAG: esterase-like activity of phytase family protein [Methylocystaceae bacterium]|nr:esterase-like activity of phytase family protein [Methylocystaceae bacterium]
MKKSALLAYVCFSLLLSTQALGDEVKIYRDAIDFAPYETPYVKLNGVTRLSSTDDRFGGLSGLMKTNKGYLAVSDRAHLFDFQDNDFSTAEVMPLLEKNDDPLDGKRRRDAESLAQGPDGGIYVSFERDHRVVLYNRAGYVISKDMPFTKDYSSLSNNSGLEAIETFKDVRLVLIGEGKKNGETSPLWVQEKSGWKKKQIDKQDGFRPTGLARIPETNRFLLLERYYAPIEGVRVRLSELDVNTGKRLARWAELGPPTPIDNLEGITVHKNEQGVMVVTLISDDNFSVLQRTLVLQLNVKKPALK